MAAAGGLRPLGAIRESRTATGLHSSGLCRSWRNAARMTICSSWLPQRNPTSTVESSNDSSRSGPTDPGMDTVRLDRAISAEEDFLRRARKMQRRIAKLRQLQDRIAQLKEEKEFLQAYMEVEASASDVDSDSDSEDPEPLPPASASAPSASASPPPAPSASSSPEELRRWVADLVAQSAVRAAEAAAAAAAGGQVAGVAGRAAGSPAGGAARGPPPGSWAAAAPAGLGRGAMQGPGAAGGQPGGPQGGPGAVTAAASGAGAPLPWSPPPLPPPALSQQPQQQLQQQLRQQQQPPLYQSQQPLQQRPPQQQQPQPPPPQPQPGVRRYSVRYSGTSPKPVFVPLPPPASAVAPQSPPAPGNQGASVWSPHSTLPATQPPTLQSQQPQPRSPLQPELQPQPQQPQPQQPQGALMGLPGDQAAAPEAPARGRSSLAGWRAAAAQAPPATPPPEQRPRSAPQDRAAPSPGTAAALQQPQPPPPAAATASGSGLLPESPDPTSAGGSSPAAASAPPTTGRQRPAGSRTPAAPAAPARDPNAELRATAFPDSLTSANPYTLYDMPLPPLSMPASWQTAAEKAAAGGGGGAAASPGGGHAEKPRDLVFVTAEVAPWSKTGGLGDVLGALPRSLAARGHRVMVVSPRYLAPSTVKRYAGLRDTGVRARLDLGPPGGGGGGVHEVGYFHTFKDGVDWVFVDHISYHREGTPYGNADGTYGDNLFRFSLLCLAACEAPLLLNIGGYHYGSPPGLPYGQNVTFVANDWHAGLVPVYVAAKYRRHGVFRQARCVLALHNLAHQGAHPPHLFSSLGLPGEWYGALEWVDTGARARAAGAQLPSRIPTINILKAALVTSDRLVTVSPAYAWEICDEAGEQGMGLTSLLRQRAAELAGIVNGIDTAEWDPRTDPYLPRNYSEGSLGGKGLCKAALQEQLGLPVDPAAPLLGFIGRLDFQKGPDLVLGALPQLVAAGCQVVMLGSGAPDYEAAFRSAQAAYPANVRAHVGFSVPLSHRILAAADILLMPSRFEPCGLNQLYAMRYGTVPVAHGTGGLRDTIDDVDPFVGEAAGGRRAGTEAEQLEELFTSGLAWGRRTAARSSDDPSTNNADYYQPFQDYFGSSGRYGPVPEEEDEDEDDSDGDGAVSFFSFEAEGGGRQGYEEGSGVAGGLGRQVSGSPSRSGRRRRYPGTGWTFAPASIEGLLDAVTAALAVYEHHPAKWRRIQQAGMQRDFSWGRAARQWEAVIEGVLAAAPYSK